MTERDTRYGTGGAARSRTGSDPGDMRDSGDMMDATQQNVSDYAHQGQEMASEFQHKANEQAEMGRERAAGTMGRAATQLREKAAHQGGKTGEFGTRVADKLESTSDYLEQHDTGEILDDIEKYVKEHPLQAVGAAAIGGFVLARILR